MMVEVQDRIQAKYDPDNLFRMNQKLIKSPPRRNVCRRWTWWVNSLQFKYLTNPMTDQKQIKKAFNRYKIALEMFPFLGKRKKNITVRSGKGLTCEVDCGSMKYKVDMPAQVGGSATAPTPGEYEAGALGSCVSIMARMWAAKLGVPIKSIKVEVKYETDRRFLFNLGDVPPHWESIGYSITVVSTASEEDVMHVLDLAHRQSHVRGDFEHSFEVKRTVTIHDPNGTTTSKITDRKLL